MIASGIVCQIEGYCPICEEATTFLARDPWFRDHLLCESCNSLPRERALALVLTEQFPFWRDFEIHESSPVQRGISLKMSRECPKYIASQFFGDEPLGTTVNGFRNENLEQQTFASESLDLVVSLDVMEHVNRPEAAFQEVYRTLRPGGAYLFTAPTIKDRVETVRRAEYLADGTVAHLIYPPEYHGNPISEEGSLVTFHYGYDLPELISRWTKFDARVSRFSAPHRGILGELTEVYLCEK